ncbi:MAG: tetratricopeptide repeat protein [Phycisphaerales bacterium]|nr:tetratricopeptide repeat protein [Phycisphaerales bacterium]
MSEPTPRDDAYLVSRSRIVSSALEAISVIVVAASLVWAVERFWTASQAEKPAFGDFVSTVLMLVSSWAAGLLLWGIAEMIRKLDALLAAYHDFAAHPHVITVGDGTAVSGGAEGRGRESPVFQELASLLREVRDITLLNDAERSKRLEMQARGTARRLTDEVPALLREHNWIEAQRRVQEARERFPTLTEWDALERQIEQVRSQVEARDLESATRQVNDLAALGAWERAYEVVLELMERHPNSPKTADLAKRVSQERERSEAESRARLMAQAQEAVHSRDWNGAMTLAGQLIERYPRSPEAHALRIQIPTLRENAEIQTRKYLEAEIRKHIEEHRYRDAVRLANELIERYPDSPQAQVLREQYEKLAEKAAAQR